MRPDRLPRGFRAGYLTAVVTLALTTRAAAQAGPIPVDQDLRAQMDRFARAREFRDLGALRDLSSPAYLQFLQDSARVRYARFRAKSASSPLTAKDPVFRRFVTELTGSTEEGVFEALASAYALIELGDRDNEASLVLVGYIYQIPKSPIVISNSSYVLARADSANAVYYLSEDWVIPLGGGTIPKRFVVEWFKYGDGRWVLNQVR